MKVIFTRHGEATDDIENKYGGWYDPDLSPKGLAGAKACAEKLKVSGIKAEIVLTSPLKRAVQTASEISQVLGAPVETSVYLKERNTYGLLCGENKDEAKKNYPELVAAYDKGEEVLGYEAYDFFLKRVKVALEKLAAAKYQAIICVTHGKFLGALFKNILNVPVKEFHDNCWAEVEIDSSGKLTLGKTEGIDFV